MKVTTDVSDQDPKDAVVKVLTEAPLGVHQVEITSCDVVVPENGKDERIEVMAKMVDGNHWPLRDYINVVSQKAKFKVDQFLMSMGVITPTKRKATWDPAAQVGKKTYVLIRPESRPVTGPDGKTETRTSSKIGGWLPKGQKAIADDDGTTTTADEEDTNEEISLEMHGAAADENEDAESIAYLTEKAAEYDIDPEEIDTWAEVAELIGNAEGQEKGTDDDDDSNEDDEEDLLALGGTADEDDDEDAQARLTELAEEAGLDPDDYDTWTKLAAQLGKADASQDEAEVDYKSQKLNWLKKECKERELSDVGTHKELVARLEEFDEDPFK